MTHWEVAFLAGQKKAANGKAGLWLCVLGSTTTALSRTAADVVVGVFCFLRALWADCVAAMIAKQQ